MAVEPSKREGYQQLTFNYVLENRSKDFRPLDAVLTLQVADSRGFTFDLEAEQATWISKAAVIPPSYRVPFQATGEYPSTASNAQITVADRSGKRRSFPIDPNFKATVALPSDGYPSGYAPKPLQDKIVIRDYAEISLVTAMLFTYPLPLPSPLQPFDPKRVHPTPAPALYFGFTLHNLWGQDISGGLSVQVIDSKGNYLTGLHTAGEAVAPGLTKPFGYLVQLEGESATGVQLLIYRSSDEYSFFSLRDADLEQGKKAFDSVLAGLAAYHNNVTTIANGSNPSQLATIATGDQLAKLQLYQSRQQAGSCKEKIDWAIDVSYVSQAPLIVTDEAWASVSNVYKKGGGSSYARYRLKKVNDRWLVSEVYRDYGRETVPCT
jgi:hypothetical protein